MTVNFFTSSVSNDFKSFRGLETPQPTPGKVLYLNPIKIGLFNAGSENTIVYTIRKSKYNGNVDLKCGRDVNGVGDGYIHIRKGHERNWNDSKNSFPGYWDDFMLYSSISALQAPSYSRDQGSGKRCYVTPIQIFKKKIENLVM